MSPGRPAQIGLVIGQLTRGGAEGQLAQLAARLDRTRFAPRVYVLSPALEPWGRWLAERGVPCTIIAPSVGERVVRLARRLRRDGIDLVHSWLFLANPFAAMAALLARLPLVASARNCKVQGTLVRWANTVAFRASTRILANSHDVAEYIASRYAAPRERVRVIPNGIDTQKFFPAPARALEAPLIVTAGRMVPQKNQALFLRAARELHSRVPQVRFAIAGDGPLRGELEQLARELGLASRVEFLGECDRLDELFRTAHVFWLTSRWEGMPNVLLEAMASGVPVVATDVGGCREIVEGSDAGTVVPADTVDGFVTATRHWLEDPQAFFRAAAAARCRAEEFSLDRMVARTQKLYDEVLQR